MSLLRWSRTLLATALVVVGYLSNPAAAAKASAAAAPAPSTPPATGAATGPALSYLKPQGREKCQWFRQPLPSGAATLLFTFDAPCNQSVLAWSPNGKEGLVFHLPNTDATPPRLWRVDFAAKTGAPLDIERVPGGKGAPDPDMPIINRVGYDAEGRPVALVADIYVNRTAEKDPKGGSFIIYNEERQPVNEDEGAPGMAFAYRFEGTKWKRIEAKASTFNKENSRGLDVLDAAKTVPLPKSPLSEPLPGKPVAKGDLKRLDTAMPGQPKTGKWMSLPTPGGTLVYRGTKEPEEDDLYASAPVRWDADGKLTELEGLTAKPGDRLGFELRGGLLHVFVQAKDTRSAHVYDTAAKKNLVSVKDIRSALLWPEPSKP